MELNKVYRERYFLAGIFLLSLLVRLVVFYTYLQHDERYWQVDSATYQKMAVALVEGKGFTKPDGAPQVHRLPGYSAFLASVYKVVGTTQPYAALLVQIVVAALIPLLIFWLSLLLFPGALIAARWCALWGALHGGFILYAGFLMTESLFILLFLIFLCLFVSLLQAIIGDNYQEKMISCEKNPLALSVSKGFFGRIIKNSSVFFAFASGLALGIASLIRPVGHYLVFVSLLILVCVGSARLRQTTQTVVVFFCSWLLPAGAWLLRNYLLTGYLFFHSLPGGHFLHLSAARVAMYDYNCSYQEARQLLRAEVQGRVAVLERKKGAPLSEIEWCFVQERLAKECFVKAPLITIKTWLTDITRTCVSLYSAELLYLDSGRTAIDYFAKGRGLFAGVKRYLFPPTENLWLKLVVYAEISMHVLLLSMSFFYCCMLFFALLQGSSQAVVAGAMVLYVGLFLGIALAGGYARMRLPIEPLLMIFALQGIVRIFSSKVKKNN